MKTAEYFLDPDNKFWTIRWNDEQPVPIKISAVYCAKCVDYEGKYGQKGSIIEFPQKLNVDKVCSFYNQELQWFDVPIWRVFDNLEYATKMCRQTDCRSDLLYDVNNASYSYSLIVRKSWDTSRFHFTIPYFAILECLRDWRSGGDDIVTEVVDFFGLINCKYLKELKNDISRIT